MTVKAKVVSATFSILTLAWYVLSLTRNPHEVLFNVIGGILTAGFCLSMLYNTRHYKSKGE